MTVSSKVRIYDLAKELKLDTKRLIEEVRREGVDVSVPSNSVSKELAEKIRNKYFPKKETAVKRAVKVVKRAAVVPTPEAPVVEAEAEVYEPEPDAPPPSFVAAEPVEQPAVATPPPAAAPAKPPVTRLVKKMSPSPAVHAEAPVIEEEAPPPVAEIEAPEIEAPSAPEPMIMPEVIAPTNGAEVRITPTQIPTATPPPSRQVRVLRPTAAALNAGIRPGERAPAPTPPPAIVPKERVDSRSNRMRERPSLPRAERLGTPGETATPQTTYIPPPDAGRRRSRRSSPRGGRKVEGRGGRFDNRDFIPPPKALSLEDRIAGRLEVPGSGELKSVCIFEGFSVK
jgi:translation initiation factor IF-2